MFDETSISLPGSLEERNRYLELPQEDEMFSSIGMDAGKLMIPVALHSFSYFLH